jgi:uncharacterized protein (DUF1501 family)
MAEASIPQNTSSEQPTRRALLGAAAAAGVAGAVPASAAVEAQSRHPDDIAALERISAIVDELEAANDALIARTLAGVAAQLRVVLSYVEIGSGVANDCDVKALRNAVATLETLAGRT